MRLVQGFLIIALVFGALAYSFNKKSVKAGALEAGVQTARAELLLQDENLAEQTAGSEQLRDIEITRATVHGDVLSVNLQYSACEDVKFGLVGTREFAESFPIQAQLQLRAEGSPDVDCAVVRSQELQFNVAELREVFHNRYNMANGTILLQLDDFPTLVRYDF